MKQIRVADEYRTNAMSLTPGGSVVEVTRRSGVSLIYDKIKMPERYIREIYPKVNNDTDPIDEITVDGNHVFHRPEEIDIFKLIL
jgi:hypothetical protein